MANSTAKRLLPILVIGAVVLLIFEWRPWHSSSEDLGSSKTTAVENNTPPQPITKLLVPPEIKPEFPKQEIRAQLTAVNYTTISSELTARVQELPFKEGQTFKKDQVLVAFECSTQLAQAQKSRALLAIAERNFQTNKQLLALGGVSRVTYENSFSEYQRAKAESDELSSIVARCNIVAPYDGLVVEQKVRSQQFVQAGQPLLEILDNSALEVEFVAPSKWFGWLVEGYRFLIRLDETGKEYPAKIIRVNGKIDPVSQTIKAVAVIDGDYKDISPGMSGVLLIQPPASSDQ